MRAWWFGMVSGAPGAISGKEIAPQNVYLAKSVGKFDCEDRQGFVINPFLTMVARIATAMMRAGSVVN
ncbi:unnamed protein product [Gongylonema pulchrum]|uniref:Glutaminase n=1 Tax=Gongylonema pulchrum TaxID=637853 RepID=A0A183EFX7_9BILA|nr:unnamed protein product [Gongylonema pulchrum]